MAKFSIEKEMLTKLRLLYEDLGFNQRAAARVNNDIRSGITIELNRTGNLDREIKKLDIVEGIIETGDIIKPKPKDKPKIAVAKK